MDAADIARLLAPFLPAPPPVTLVARLQTYLDLLLRWNQRLNLTAVRDPEHIVTRHFGESLFAASHWLATDEPQNATVIDVGSGAGFPGIPLKLYAPSVSTTLIEAHGKKATFLREVIRTLGLPGIRVLNQRAELVSAKSDSPTSATPAHLVTLRAVEQFDTVLPIAFGLVAPGGRLGLLVGSAQVRRAAELLPDVEWSTPVAVPNSNARVVLTGVARS
jgi:16S rRNA (guanine527-N7)-methyltransferase